MADYQPGFWEAENSEFWDAIAGDYVDILTNGVNGGVAALPAQAQIFVDWDLVNMWALEMAKTYRYELITGINETTKEFVSKAVMDWIESGDPITSLAAVLRMKYNAVRAEMIATTEVTRMYAMGNQLAWRSTGLVDKFRWMTAEDELVCTICGGHNGNEYPLSQLDKMMPAHPRCRCWSQPVVSLDMLRQRLNQI